MADEPLYAPNRAPALRRTAGEGSTARASNPARRLGAPRIRDDRLVFVVLIIGVLGAAAIGLVEWRIHGPYGESDSRVGRSVDPATGLTVIAFNAKGYGKPNIWCFLNGARLVRMEFDQDGDGIIDRLEYYSSNGTLERAYRRDASGARSLVQSAPDIDEGSRLPR